MKNIQKYKEFINEEWNPIKRHKEKNRARELERNRQEIEREKESEKREEIIILENQPPEIEEYLYYFENIDNYIVNVKPVDGPFYSSKDFKIILSDGNKIHLRYSESDGFESIDYDMKINNGNYISLTWKQHKIIKDKIDKFLKETWD